MLNRLVIGTVALALTLATSHTTAVAAETKDIVDTAVSAGSFKTLAKALEAADLVTTLKGAGPFTVFAPTDEAFAKLPAGTLETLLKPENKAKLRRILTYHVVAGKVMASDVVKHAARPRPSAATRSPSARATAASWWTTPRSTKTDIVASNGVIHVIDAVILPKEQVGFGWTDESCSPAQPGTSAAVFFASSKRTAAPCGVSRGSRPESRPTRPTTEVVQGDCLDEASLDRALAGVQSAYYLVHSMAGRIGLRRCSTASQPPTSDRPPPAPACGASFILADWATNAGSLSTHLKSRAETGEVLRASGVPVIEFQASVVIGAGSLSFEMIQALVERLPVMVCPRWVATLTQPIAIDDVLAYLAAALDLPESGSTVFEIGGPEVVSYGDMMREYARLRGLRRLLLPVPLLTPHLSGLWLGLVTPAQARVGRALVEGLRNSDRRPIPGGSRNVPDRTDAASRRFPESHRGGRCGAPARSTRARWSSTCRRTRRLRLSAASAAPPGWYFGNLLWLMRGWLDRAVGGAGMRSRASRS